MIQRDDSPAQVRPAIQTDYSKGSALAYYVTFNVSYSQSDDPEDPQLVEYYGWDVDRINDPDPEKRHNPNPQAIAILALLDDIALPNNASADQISTAKKVLIFTDKSSNLTAYWYKHRNFSNLVPPNFSVVEVVSGNQTNGAWARDYLGRPVYTDRTSKVDVTYVDTRDGSQSENMLSPWMASTGGVAFKSANSSLPGGNIIVHEVGGTVICYLSEDSVVDVDFNRDTYGCDENVVLKPTTAIHHVDLTMSIVPVNPNSLDKFKLVNTIPSYGYTPPSNQNYIDNAATFASHVSKYSSSIEKLVSVPFDVYGFTLSPSNFVVVPEAGKIVVSLPKRASNAERNDDVVNLLKAEFPAWTVERVEIPTEWGGGVHCFTGQLTVTMYNNISATLGVDRIGQINLTPAVAAYESEKSALQAAGSGSAAIAAIDLVKIVRDHIAAPIHLALPIDCTAETDCPTTIR